MPDPLDFEKRPLFDRLRRLRRLAWLSLAWEYAALVFWRIDCWIGFFTALWLFQIPALAGNAGNRVALVVFFAGLIFLLRHDLHRFRWPTRRAADRRLEEASGLTHRPLTNIEDELANPDRSLTRQIWDTGKSGALALVSYLKIPGPRPVLTGHDPAALRFLVVLLLIAGFAVAGPEWNTRLTTGLTAFSFQSSGGDNNSITLWITPPDYTGRPQVTLQGSGRSNKSIDVPAGSQIRARVRGGLGQPYLIMGETKLPLKRIDKRIWSLETPAHAAGQIEIRQTLIARAQIPINYIPDQPPRITLKTEPKIMPKGALQFDLLVQDDYGVTDITLHMNLDPAVRDAPKGQPYSEARDVMSAPAQEQEIAPLYDMTSHVWAGLPVIIDLEVRDHQGQSARTDPLHITLPERAFYHPVAAKIAALRKRLIWTPESAAPNVAYDLQGLLAQRDKFNGDIIAFLSLRSAASRLTYDPTDHAAAFVVPQLWDTALRIEEGNLTLAGRDLKKAREALEKILKDPNASQEQISQAMDDFRDALAAYFQEIFTEMQKQMAKSGGIPPNMSPDSFAKQLNAEDLINFLEQLQAQALSGDRDSARQMLSQLQQMMDTLDGAMGSSPPPEMQFMMEAVNKLKELVEKQQTLLDRTREQASGMPDSETPVYPDFMPYDKDILEQWGAGDMPPPPSRDNLKGSKADSPPEAQINTQKEKDVQETLRQDLGELMNQAGEKMDKIPDNLQHAEQEMRNSTGQLTQNRPDLSAPYQEKVLEELKQSLEDMNQQLMAMMKQMMMLSLGMNNLDPLGRPIKEGDGPSLLPGSKVKIPNEAQKKQVQEIIKTLRQRSGEMDRPDYELDYYRRLMKQF